MLLNLLNHFFAILPRSGNSVGFRAVDCPHVETLEGDLYPNVEYQSFTYEPVERELVLFNELVAMGFNLEALSKLFSLIAESLSLNHVLSWLLGVFLWSPLEIGARRFFIYKILSVS